MSQPDPKTPAADADRLAALWGDEDDSRPEVTELDYLNAAARAVSEAAEHGPVSVDPDVAEHMGAFEEDALSAEDALDSMFDPEDEDEEIGDEA